MNEKLKKGIALGIVGLMGLGLGAGSMALFAEDKVIVEEKIVEVPFEVPVEVTKEVMVEKIVEVDNGDMAWAFERFEDKGIIEDAEEILMELKAEDEALMLAFDYMDSEEFLDDLEEEDVIRDEDEAEIVKIYSDFDDVEVLRSDFDDEEYKFKIKFKVEDEDREKTIKSYAVFKVEDGDVDFVKVTEE